MNEKLKALSSEEKKRKIGEKTKEYHQLTLFSVIFRIEKETLNKNNTKHTFQILKKCLSSVWKCIYINTQAVNIYSTYVNMLFHNLQARK